MGIPTPNHRPTRPFAGAGAGLLLSQFPRHLISNETLERKGNPKTIVFWRKPPKRRLWRMKRGGFEEVSRFSRHNVAGNRLTRRCVLLPTFPAGGKSGPAEARPLHKTLWKESYPEERGLCSPFSSGKKNSACFLLLGRI